MSTSAKSWFGLSGSQRPIFSLKFSSVMMSTDAMFAALRICRFHRKPLLGFINREKGERGFDLSLVATRPNQTKINRQFCSIDNARKELGGHAETLEQRRDINKVHAKDTTNTEGSSSFRLYVLVV